MLVKQLGNKNHWSTNMEPSKAQSARTKFDIMVLKARENHNAKEKNQLNEKEQRKKHIQPSIEAPPETKGNKIVCVYLHLKDFFSSIDWSRAIHACRCIIRFLFSFFSFHFSIVVISIVLFTFFFLFQSFFFIIWCFFSCFFIPYHFSFHFPRLSKVTNPLRVNVSWRGFVMVRYNRLCSNLLHNCRNQKADVNIFWSIFFALSSLLIWPGCKWCAKKC